MTISIAWTGKALTYRGERLRPAIRKHHDSSGHELVGIIRSFEAFYRKQRQRFAALRSCHNCYAAASSIVSLWIANVRMQREPTNRRFTDEDFCCRGKDGTCRGPSSDCPRNDGSLAELEASGR